MFKIAGILLLAGVAGILIAAAFAPDKFRIQRSARIDAQPARIYPLINDMAGFNRWNPFARKDPAMLGSYRGPAQGLGAGYSFKGAKSGEGSIEIVDTKPGREVVMRLDMLRPFAAHDLITFTLAPLADATQVTWAMEGDVPFIGKILHLFLNMDKMVGGDFEAGLANLKSLAEHASPAYEAQAQ